ncbi:hypothetical protein HPB50_024060 [Hyalomma asiaticum]|uniref:Uncharacterized protein n=1 Tax=Hyalomma asiaticum TaxID=266040 RepID=A0ACB7SS56_HYAAI|nr:hypothetical protein HPB50_024060 [Hyalomma asiaticum]
MLAKLFFLSLVLTVANCQIDDAARLIRAHNQFAVNLLKELAAQEPSSNIFFSPTSIAAAFGMAYAGARGESEAELNSVLGHTALGLTDRSSVLEAYKGLLELSSSPNVTLDVANMLLAQDSFPISESYKQQLREIFDADVKSANFHEDGPRVAAEVNAWVRGKTRGKVSGILPEGQALDIVLFILNAVYFKGTWVSKFDAHMTTDRPFFNLGTTEVRKPAMQLWTRFPYTELGALEASAVEIPYEGDRFSMVVLLPNNATGLTAVRNGLSLDLLEEIRARLSSMDVILQLPKFELSRSYGLVATMRALGLNSVFGSSADFSAISESVQLAISDVRHKAAFEVDEEGTVATAVTGIGIVPISAQFRPQPAIEFPVNRPFIFYIRDRTTNRVLFMGETTPLVRLDSSENVRSRPFLGLTNVIMILPKFEMSCGYGLVPAMRAFGMKCVLGTSVGLRFVSEAVQLVISYELHEAVVEVDEEGTMATPLTELRGVPYSAYYHEALPTVCSVEHPSIFYISDGAIGRVFFTTPLVRLDSSENVRSRPFLGLTNVIMILPKFEMSCGYGLVPAMRAFGMKCVLGTSVGLRLSVRPCTGHIIRAARGCSEVDEEGTMATPLTELRGVPYSAYYHEALPTVARSNTHPSSTSVTGPSAGSL